MEIEVLIYKTMRQTNNETMPARLASGDLAVAVNIVLELVALLLSFIHCLFLFMFRICCVGEYWGGRLMYVYIVVVVVITEQWPRHNLRSRSGGSILIIKGWLGFGSCYFY